MILYDYPGGPNPRRVRIFLAEKGISVPMETVDILKRRNRQPDFLEKNPTGGIPILELDDGTCISESVAIGAISRNCIPSRLCSAPARNSAPSSRCGCAGSS